ncbi:hypothetical protein B7695_02755 [Streptococcus mitis]|uniref:Uncharacterized protein n=1 Tax=Streptococcus mitis TaxID=28037 RepID=A0A1X1KYG6_STRMT|nr:hypothetical protein B7695_02755 [Streptococcus mitis]
MRKFYKTPPYSPIATIFSWSIVQKQGKLKNRKPILQTKVQKTAKLTNRKENHGLRNNTEGTVLGRKKASTRLTLRKEQEKVHKIHLDS